MDTAALWERREAAAASAQVEVTEAGGKQPYEDVAVLERFVEPLGLVSNNQAETVEFLLSYHDLPAFETAYGRSPSLEGAARRKPEPYYLEQALADIDAETAVYVGDSPEDVVAAHRAGLDSVFLRRDHVADAALEVEPTYEVGDLHEFARVVSGASDTAASTPTR